MKQIAADSDRLDNSHEEWLQGALALERQLRQQGLEIQRVMVDVDELAAWCRSQERPIDGDSRSAYAAEMARRSSSTDS